MSERLLLSLWSQHAGWAEVAARLRARRKWWHTVALILTIGGAALQTLAIALENAGMRRGVGTIGVLALLAVALLSGRFLTPSETRRWLRSRSVAEGIKSEIYAYRAGAAPYVGVDALEELRLKVGSIVDWAKDLALEVEVGVVMKPLPPPLSAELYLLHRVDRAIERFYRRAKGCGSRAQFFHWLQIALVIAAAAVGIFATVLTDHSNGFGSWIAVLTTIVGGVAAYAAGSRFELQATMSLATVRQLQDLVDAWRASGQVAPSSQWSAFVHACEEVICGESRGWMAKINQEPIAAAPATTLPPLPVRFRRLSRR